jgi:hypothetical protein
VGLGIVDTVRGADFQTRNLLWALAAGEPYRIARALAVEAGYSAAEGQKARRRTERLLAAADTLARRIDHPHAIGLSTMTAGVADFLDGAWARGQQRCEAAVEIFRERCTGAAWELDSATFFVLWSLLYRGRFAELARCVPTLLREAQERGDRFAATNLRSSFMPLLCLAEDRPLDGRHEGERSMRRWSRQGFHLQHYNFEMFANPQISLYLGDGAAAHRAMVERWPALRASMLPMIQHLRIEALHTRARAALGAAVGAPASARDSLLRAAARDARRIAREGTSWSRPWSELVRAGIAAASGDPPEAIRRAARAAAGFERADMALYAAAARRRWGELVGGDEGQRVVTEADAVLRAEKIENPEQMVATLAPGF